MAKPAGPSVVRHVLGVALMLVGVALIGYGAHFLAISGNCSSTGYVSYGPVPKCSGGEAFYIISVFFLGPLLAVVGWLMARLWGVLWPSVCLALGAGLVTIRLDASPPRAPRHSAWSWAPASSRWRSCRSSSACARGSGRRPWPHLGAARW